MNTFAARKFIRLPSRNNLLPDDKGQALIEAVVVLPVLILLIWGVIHLHLSAFYSARAEMAVRHAAWIKSLKENSSAAFEGSGVMFENGVPNGVHLDSFTVKGDAGLVIDLGHSGESASGVLNAVGSAFSAIGGWMQKLMEAIPLTQPLSLNAEAAVQFSVTSPGLDPFQKTTRAYFANRYKHLYFHNIWNLFKSAGSSDFPPMGEAKSSKAQMEEMVRKFEEELEKNKDSLSAEEYQHYQEQIQQWREWIRRSPY